jgi:hypothetical protein
MKPDELDIEIIYDPTEAAVGSGQAMDETHQILPDGDWIRHIKRETGRDDLFVYFHTFTRKFVLAGWVYKPGEIGVPVCTELDTMDIPPDRGGWLSTQYVKARVRPLEEQVNTVRSRMKEAEYAKKALKSDDLEQRNQVVEYYRKKGDTQMMRMIEHSPYTGEASGGEPLREMTEELTGLASNKTITSG